MSQSTINPPVMLSNKPYLLRAFYEWIVDSGCTPVIIASATHPDCKVPPQAIEKNGEVVLNISPNAIRELNMGNDFIAFRASFATVQCSISLPIAAIRNLYAHENGVGIQFDDEEGDVQSIKNETFPAVEASQAKKVSHLRLVE